MKIKAYVQSRRFLRHVGYIIATNLVLALIIDVWVNGWHPVLGPGIIGGLIIWLVTELSIRSIEREWDT